MPVSQTRGVILLAAAQKKISVLEFTPLQMKMAAGASSLIISVAVKSNPASPGLA